MFSREQIAEIERLLENGKNPSEVARALNVSRGSLDYRLAQSGKRIETTRRLKNIQAVKAATAQEDLPSPVQAGRA